MIRNVPQGLGEPVFDKFEAQLAHAMLSIPATKAFEIGSGFRGTEVPGSKHNDLFVRRPDGRLGTSTNWSGGVQGGITNGEDIYFRCALLIALLNLILTVTAQSWFQVARDDLTSAANRSIRRHGGLARRAWAP